MILCSRSSKKTTRKFIGKSVAGSQGLDIACEDARRGPGRLTMNEVARRRDERSQEVATVKLYLNERPPALLAARAPWSGLPVAHVDAVCAHVETVGRSGVAGGMALQAAQIQLQGQRIRVQGTSG